jgi:hypothetical protein
MKQWAGMAILLAAQLAAGCATMAFVDYMVDDYTVFYSSTSSGKGLSIVKYHGDSTDPVIPFKLGGRNVISIARGAFRNKQLTGVTIPEGVTEIVYHAFAENQLTGVTIPGSVTEIGDSAFRKNQLTSVTIPGSVTKIVYHAFAENQLTSVTIPGSVTEIGGYAFWKNQLASVTIPESVDSLGFYAFWKNPLEQVTVKKTLPADETGWTAFDSLTPAFIANGGKAGVYTKEGPYSWAHNGSPLPRVAAIATSPGYQIVKIDGESPHKYETTFGYLADGSTAYLIPAGLHTLELAYDTRDSKGYGTWSKGTVTFEMKYLFEGTNYVCTGEIDKKEGQIIFRIVAE